MELNNVDAWINNNTFDVSTYNDYELLYRLKSQKKLTISVIIPTLEEEKTIGNILNVLVIKLMNEIPLIDEIIVIDGGSKDNTINICSEYNDKIRLIQEEEVLTSFKSKKGKGNQLWKGLFCTNCDIVIYMDSDLKNFDERFAIGIIGPLLHTNNVKFVKGYYERKYTQSSTAPTNEGGRVTEICARPLINLLYPSLSGFIQPLGGEYGGFTNILKNIEFSTGYGVEMKILMEIVDKHGLECMGQVNLYSKEHDHQPLNALTKMSSTIIKTVLNHKLSLNIQSKHLLIKNSKSPVGENTKIRSEEHVHCNNHGTSMSNEYFKYIEIDDLDLPPINEIQRMDGSYRERNYIP